jgi:hypothetical protein
MYFWYISHVYQNTHVPYILHEMHSFASVFKCFHCIFTAETCTFGSFPMYTKMHMYHIFYMKCTVLLVFSCVFTVFSLQKHVLSVHFTCILKYTCTIYSTWNAQFCQWFYVFSLCFHWRNMWFLCFHINTKIHMYHIFYMKCTVLLVFSCLFIVFKLQKHVLLVYFTCIPKYTCTIYSPLSAQFCLCFYVFLMCFYCRNMFFCYITHVFIKININHIFYMECTVLLVFSCVFMCFHCVFTVETCTLGTFHI